jgi:hypothetical protein
MPFRLDSVLRPWLTISRTSDSAGETRESVSTSLESWPGSERILEGGIGIKVDAERQLAGSVRASADAA